MRACMSAYLHPSRSGGTARDRYQYNISKYIYCIVSISNNSAGPFIGCLINVPSLAINLHLPSLAATIEVEACYFWVISLMSRAGPTGVKIAFAWRGIMTEEKSVKTNRRASIKLTAYLTPIYRISVVFFC